jgi:DNA-binding transcriptional regulator YdaS (Cro superfamily)
MEQASPLLNAENALDRAIAAVGSRAELARRLQISRAAVAQWRVTPIRRVREVSEITGVPIGELCPDLAAKTNGAAA